MSKAMLILTCTFASALGAAVLGIHETKSDQCLDLRDYSVFQKGMSGPCEARPEVIWKSKIVGGGLKTLQNPRARNVDTFYVTDIWSTGSVDTDIYLPPELRLQGDIPTRALIRVPPGMTRLPQPLPIRHALELTTPQSRGESFDLIFFGYYDTSPEIIEIRS